MSVSDWPNVDFQDPASVERFEKFAEDRKNMLIEVNARNFESGAAYTNLVILAGYAAAFSVWAFVKDDLTSPANAIVAVCLSVSLVIFVGYEVYKMVRNTNTALAAAKILRTNKPALEVLADIRALRVKQQTESLTVVARIWAIALWPTLFFAGVAALVLFYNLFAGLFQWPGWPAEPPTAPELN